MGDFEWALVAALNRFFEEGDIQAIAYRLKQHRFTAQSMDILVDSPQPRYYLAIECKSLDARKTRSLYFSQHFNSAGGGHQIERESQFLQRSGRTGILAVELRRGPGKPKTAHLVPWSLLQERFLSGGVGLSLEELEAQPALSRRGGEYEILDL
ncbi:MAG: hypothetical protein GKC10_04245 [Methanosarcinales archaeon]|nr:hypothetical protein [Methanosarcinales archaeon]